MYTRTHFIDREEYLTLVSEVLTNLQVKYDKLAGNFLIGDDSSSFSGKGIFALAATLISKPIYARKTKYDMVEATVVSQLLDIVDRAEKLSEGGGNVAFETCTTTFLRELPKLNDHRNTAALQRLLKADLDALADAMSLQAVPYKKQELYNDVVATLEGPNNLSTAVIEALNLAGIQGNVVVETSAMNETLQVEKKTGYHFQGITVPAAFMQTATREWNRRNVRVLCVDGIIEKVSELDKLLTAANTTKQSMVIVAQGFSEEVLGTLQVNFTKKLLDVVPVLLEPSLETLNVVNDVSVVCGAGSLVSTLQGELLLYKTLESLPIVEKLVISANELVIQNRGTRTAVLGHVKELLGKRSQKMTEGFQLTDLAMLYEKRVHSLMANTVALTLPVSTEGVATSKREKIDRVLRSIKTKLAYGKVNLNNLKFTTPMTVLETPKAANDTEASDHLATFVGVWFGSQKAFELLEASGVVTVDV